MRYPGSGFLLIVSAFFAFTALPAKAQESAVASFAETSVVLSVPTEAQMSERLSKLDACMPLRVTPVVESYVNAYILKRTDHANIMLGRRLTYFPLFEQKLKEAGMPEDLKYLAIVESALNPNAISSAGAVGLWQFMPYTGKEYGLERSVTHDGRIDPVKSTEAAVRYLKKLHRIYDDWALALAAYNSGPGRVNRAIRRAHSRNFWRVMAFLPRETRNYVPAFIAATYLSNYHLDHGLQPIYPDHDEQLTAYIKIFESLTFQQIHEATGVDLPVIESLNPGYLKQLVPARQEGNYVVLPERVMPTFVRFLNGRGKHKYLWETSQSTTNPNSTDGRYSKVYVQIEKGGPVKNVANALQCSVEHLKAWNNLSTNYIAAGQALTLWRPVYLHSYQKLRVSLSDLHKRPLPKLEPPAVIRNDIMKKDVSSMEVSSDKLPAAPQYLWHTMRRGESINDLAIQYQVSVKEIRALNEGKNLKTGTRVRVKSINR